MVYGSADPICSIVNFLNIIIVRRPCPVRRKIIYYIVKEKVELVQVEYTARTKIVLQHFYFHIILSKIQHACGFPQIHRGLSNVLLRIVLFLALIILFLPMKFDISCKEFKLF